MSTEPRTQILDALPADEAGFPSITYPPRQRVWRGFPLHPNFWWSLLWCSKMLLLTQVLGGVVAIVLVMVVYAIVSPDGGGLGNVNDPAEMMQQPVFQIGIGLGIWLAHFLMILLSLVVLRVVAGRSWHREVAVRKPAWIHVGLVLALVPAFILLANGAYAVTERIGIPNTANLFQAAAFVCALCMTLFVLGMGNLFLCNTVSWNWSDRLWNWNPVAYSAGLMLTFFVLVTGFFLALKAIGFAIVPGGLTPKDAGGMEGMMKMIANWPLPLALFLIGVMPGFSEELWCRAYLGRGLVGKHGYFWGVLTASFLFGLIHLDPRQGTMAAVLGIVLHYVYLTTRSLWMPMLLHFANNSLAVVLARLSHPVADVEKDAASLPWMLFVAGGVLMVAIGWALYQTRARLVAPEGVHPWQPPYPGVACPPAGSLTVVHTPWPSAVSVVAVGAALGAFAVAAVLALHGR